MLIRKLDPNQFVDAYDIKAQVFYPWDGVISTPFSSAWAVVRPKCFCKPHNHHDQETFFIVRGRGRMTVNEDVRDVEPGDVIYIPPFSKHILENTAEDDLHFMAVWWEDRAVLEGLVERAAAGVPAVAGRRISVFAAPGAAAEAAAGTYARYVRARGAEARVTTGGSDGAGQRLLDILQARGEIVPGPGGTAGFRLSAHAGDLRELDGSATLPPYCKSLLDRALAEGLADVPLDGPGSAGLRPLLARLADLLVPGSGGSPWAEAERRVVFADALQGSLAVVLLPALIRAADPAAPLPEVVALARPGWEASPAVPEAWITWLRELGEKLVRDHEGTVPGTNAWTVEQQGFFGTLGEIVKATAATYEAADLSPEAVLRELDRLVWSARRFAASEAPWREAPNRKEVRNTGVALEVAAAKVFAQLAAPLLPDFAARLWHHLGYEGDVLSQPWEETPSWVPGGQAVRGLGEIDPAGGV